MSQTKAWLELNVIEPIPTPPLLNNLVLVAKKDGRIRVCVDCTPANDVTSSFDWPLPRLAELRFRTTGSSWFSRIDLKDAFFRISVPAQYRHLTAYMAGGQSYQFRKMPFGLKTAPSVFQRYMDWGLSTFAGWAFWYIDDVLIFADSRKELRRREALVRKQLHRMGSSINEDKSVSEVRRVLFTGLWIFAEGMGPNLQQRDQLLGLQLPRTKAELQSALGLVSYLRDFIPLVGHYTAQLYPTKDGVMLTNTEYEAQWQKLRRHLAQAVLPMNHWKRGVPADLYTDASGYALGIITVQSCSIVAVASRKLTAAERNYSATDREHLGLVFAAERFRMFLHQSDSPVRVWSDHSALLTRKPDKLTPRQARWNTVVQSWIPRVEHVKGKLNPADFVSRWALEGVGANFQV